VSPLKKQLGPRGTRLACAPVWIITSDESDGALLISSGGRHFKLSCTLIAQLRVNKWSFSFEICYASYPVRSCWFGTIIRCINVDWFSALSNLILDCMFYHFSESVHLSSIRPEFVWAQISAQTANFAPKGYVRTFRSSPSQYCQDQKLAQTDASLSCRYSSSWIW